MALVVRIKNGEPGAKTVRNLGWLLRHAGEVEDLVVLRQPHGAGHAALLVARMEDGGSFVTRFADLSVLFDWLTRRRDLFAVHFIDLQGRTWSGTTGSRAWADASASLAYARLTYCYHAWIVNLWQSALPRMGQDLTESTIVRRAGDTVAVWN